MRRQTLLVEYEFSPSNRYFCGWRRDKVKDITNEIKNTTIEISPQYITGFVDGEGSFAIFVGKKSKNQNGKRVFLIFSIAQTGEKGKDILLQICKFFSVGNVSVYEPKPNRTTIYRYYIQSIENITKVIIPFFNCYPLYIKREEFEIWREVALFLKNKKRGLTQEDLKYIEEKKEYLKNIGSKHRK
jgi:hypothetical protein